MLGSAAVFAVYVLAQDSGSKLLLALAYSVFMLNLFNLIPLSPLDASRIVGVISPKICFVGIPLLSSMFFWHPSPVPLIVAALAVQHLWTAYKNRNSGVQNQHITGKRRKRQKTVTNRHRRP
jgi:Zn-dependent protease